MSHQTSEVILATGGYDHTIRFWEALSGVCIRTIQYADSQINRMTISNDKRFLAVAGNPHLRLYDVQSSNTEPVATFEGHTGNVTSVSFEAAGRWLVSSSEDGTIKIWDARAPGIQRDYELKTPVNEVLIHPNQGELVSADQSGGVRVWDLGENQCTSEFIPEEDVPMQSVSMSAEGNFLVAANDKGNFYVWMNKQKENVCKTEQPKQSFEPVQQVNAHGKYITKCLLSPDSRYLATCSADHTVKIWNTMNGKFTLLNTLNGHQKWVWDCIFSADSAYLVTASSDNSARLWDLSTGETIKSYNGHQKAVISVALHDISL